VAIAAAATAAGCDRSATEPQPPEPQKIASILLDVDIATGQVHATTLPLASLAPNDRLRTPGGISATTNVDGLLRASNLRCLGCDDGTLGAHQVSLTLTNASAFTISGLIEVIQCVSNCSVLTATNPPTGSVPSGGSFNAAVAVDVPALAHFTIRIDYLGDVT